MLKKMKIGQRLILGFVIVAVVVSLAGIFGLVLVTRLSDQYSVALVENGFVQGNIGDFNTYLNKGGAIVRDIITLTDSAEVEASVAELESVKQMTTEALDATKLNCKAPEELVILGKIDENMELYKPLRDKAVALGLADSDVEAMEVFRKEARPYLNICMDEGDKLMVLNDKIGTEVSTSLGNQAEAAKILIGAILAVGFAAAIILGVMNARSISRPVSEIERAASEMANGNYDTNILYTAPDEIGSLADSMRKMMRTTKDIILDTERGLSQIATGNFNISPTAEYIGVFKNIEKAMITIITDLSNTLSQIKTASVQVASGSDQVSGGAQELAQGATEQASTIEELSASIADVSEHISQNADNASSARSLAVTVEENIFTSNTQMAHMMDAMSKISDSSAQIGKIIKTIEDIAFQTNILALNAAVEAARAGAAGKGFAVVADEVRNLATKSSDAAKQTGQLIEGSILAVANGVSIAEETAKSLEAVVDGAKKITVLISEISQASTQQSSSIAQITMGVEQISSVVQTNSATSEQSAAAAEELSGQASMMQGLVNEFKLKGINL